MQRKLLILPIYSGIIVMSLIFLIVLYYRLNKDFELLHKPDMTVEEVVGESGVLFETVISPSPNKQHSAFVAVNKDSMQESRVYVVDRYGDNKTLLAEDKNYRYFTTPYWSPDGKRIAFMQIYPMELWVVNMDGSNKKVVYSEKDHKDDSILNPSLGYGGKSELEWLNNEEIIFENNKDFPASKYVIDVDTKKWKKIETEAEVETIAEVGTDYDNLDVPFYSQRDQEWEEKSLGSCKEDTIGSAGCAISSLAMLLTYHGYETTPMDLNDYLSEYKDKGYFEGCDVRWNMIVNYAKDLELKGVYFNEYNLDRLRYEIDKGNPVLVGWNNVAFTPIQHWAVVTGYEKNKTSNLLGTEDLYGEYTYYVNDPWSKTGEQVDLRYFGNKFDHMVVYSKVK